MRIRYTDLALRDLEQAYDFIALDSPGNARAVIGRVEKTIDTLLIYPAIGKPGRVGGTREFGVLHTPFIIVYRHSKTTLQILTVLHSSRKYPDAE